MGRFVNRACHQGTRVEIVAQPYNSRSAQRQETLSLGDIKRGFDLTGALPRSGVFTQKFCPASMTCEDLRTVSNLSRSVLLESVQGSGDKETDLSHYKKGRKRFHQRAHRQR